MILITDSLEKRNLEKGSLVVNDLLFYKKKDYCADTFLFFNVSLIHHISLSLDVLCIPPVTARQVLY